MKFGTRDFHTMLLLLSTVSFSVIGAAMATLFLWAWMKLTPFQALTTSGRLMPEVEIWICDVLCSYNHWRIYSGPEIWRGDSYHECFVFSVFFCLLLSAFVGQYIEYLWKFNEFHSLTPDFFIPHFNIILQITCRSPKCLPDLQFYRYTN